MKELNKNVRNTREITDILHIINLSASMAILKEASDKAIDGTSIHNKKMIRQLDAEMRRTRIFDSNKKKRSSKSV